MQAPEPSEETEAASEEKPRPPTIFEAVCGSQEHTQRAAQLITNGVTGVVDKVQTLLVYWEKRYKHLWDTDKDAYLRCALHLTLCHTTQLVLAA